MKDETKEIRIQGNRGSQSEGGGSEQSLHKGEFVSTSKSKSDKTIRYFSMFTGVGGFELGLTDNFEKTQTHRDKKSWEDRSNTKSSNGNGGEQCSFSPIGFSEIDKYASELLKQRFPTVKNWGDCTKINPSELPDFDMLCGGFPCQSFSIVGKRRGFKDTRGTMFFEIARILKVKRPKLVLLENVKGLLNHEKGKTFSVIIQTLEELGYRTQWMVLNSKFFGVPQNRERIFIVGSLREQPRPEVLPFRESYKENIIRNKEENYTADYRGDEGLRIRMDNITPTMKKRAESRDHYNSILTFKKDMKIRRLTPLECERLQGFPEGWTEGFSDTQRYKMMGNAVTVNVIKAIGEMLK